MPPPARLSKLLKELRRRHVFRATFGYAVVAWVVLQVADVIVEPLSLPGWTLTLIIVVLGLGLPVVLVVAWFFDMTTEVAEDEIPTDDPPTLETGRPSTDAGPVGEGALVSHFEVLQRLGEGGMGVVYRARDTRLDRTVALKVLPPHLVKDEEAERRFLLEARAAAKLDHPNICTVHEIGPLDGGGSFIAMALYEGRTLAELLDERDRLPEWEVAGIGAQIARGLARAHAAEVVHRDIKPGNVLLTHDGVVKILDFGIAKMAGVDLTEDGAALGTVSYMSPEQIRGQTVDARTDLWAVGVVMYEACSGVRPFIGLDRASVLHGILELDPPPLTDMIPGFSAELWKLIERCVEKAPEERPGSADDVATELERLSESLRGVTVASGTARGTARPEPSLAAEGERRQATVLVAELAGAGRLEESLLPEDSRRLIEECREAMAEIVRSHDGVVNRNDGETLQALFGIPVSREDDAKRAVLAGRALCRRVAEIIGDAGGRDDGVGLRCGIDTRRVVVRRERTARSKYRVVGAAVDLSVRLAGQAREGEVLISQDCHRLVEPFFETEPAESLPGRGGDQAVSTFRVRSETGVRTRFEAAAASRGLSELSGRKGELEALLSACDQVQSGQGRFVSIVGEAGVGKSRLLYEFGNRIDASRFHVVRGRCQSFGADTPYLPFVDALRDQLDLPEGIGRDAAGVVAEQVEAVSPDLARFTPYYLQLLSLGESEAGQEGWGGEGLKGGLVESLSALVTLGAQKKPMILMLEDWHWVDGASHQVLLQLLEMVSAYPLLIVATTRPEGEMDWGVATAHTPIVLGPLGRDESSAIIRSALEASEVPEPLLDVLHRRTGGNPFFLEEVCQTLREDGTLTVEDGRVSVVGLLESVQLPDTVQGVLRTRLDRLDGPTRRLVRCASVIGREFDLQVLEHALCDEEGWIPGGLDRLRDLGLIQQIRVVPVPTYRFKHVLTQEVAYDSLLERQRSSIHGAVGDALESVHPGRLDEQLDRLAEHFAQARRWEKAVEYGFRATDRRWSFSEFQEASEANTRTLEWVDHLPESEERFEKQVDLLLRQERLYEHTGQRMEQQQVIDRLTGMLDPERDRGHLATAYVRQGDLFTLTREHEGAESALHEALRLSTDESDAAIRRNALRSLGLLRWQQERHEEALGHVEEAVRIDRELGNQESLISNLVNMSVLHRALGESDLALADLAEALQLERSITQRGLGVTVKEPFILQNMSIIYAALGDNDRALEFLEEAREIGDRSSGSVVNVEQMHYHLIAMARLHLEAGRLDDCLALYRESVARTRKARHLEGLAQSLRLLGEVLLNLERYDEALPALEEAGGLFDRLRDRRSEGQMWRGVAIARGELGDPAASVEAWERVAKLAESVGDDPLVREAAEGLAAHLRRVDPERALLEYERALAVATEPDEEEKRGRLWYNIALLQWEGRRYEEALTGFEASFESLTAAGDDTHAGLALNSIGRTLRDLGRLDEARARLEEAIALNRGSGQRLLEAHGEAALGDVLLDLERPKEAEARMKAALEIRRALDDPAGEAWMLCGLVRVHRAMGSSEGAAYYLAEAEAIATRLGDAELASTCVALRAEPEQDNQED